MDTHQQLPHGATTMSTIVFGSPGIGPTASGPIADSVIISRSIVVSGGSQFIDELFLHNHLSLFGEIDNVYQTEENVFSISFVSADAVKNLLARSPADKSTLSLHGLRIHYFHSPSNQNNTSNNGSSNNSGTAAAAAAANNAALNSNATAPVLMNELPNNDSAAATFPVSQVNHHPNSSVVVGAAGGSLLPATHGKSRSFVNGGESGSGGGPPHQLRSHYHHKSVHSTMLTAPSLPSNAGYNPPLVPYASVYKGILPPAQYYNMQSTPCGSNNSSLLKDNYPTRILVSNDLIGAIIGRLGEKIKDITVSTGARVDVKREVVSWNQYTGQCNNNNNNTINSSIGLFNAKDPNNFNQQQNESQIVFIYGNPENTSLAVRRIMEICMHETETAGMPEKPHLGMLAEDRFCGRIIGREGKNLNTIRDETGAMLFVTNSSIVTQLLTYPQQYWTMDRIIDIRGTLDAMCLAEVQISAKLRLFHRQDLQRNPLYSSMPSTLHDVIMNNVTSPYSTMDPSYGNYMSPTPGPLAYHGSSHLSGSVATHNNSSSSNFNGSSSSLPAWIVQSVLGESFQLDDALYMRIPHVSAGAVIGTDGSSIKKIMDDTKTIVSVSKAEIVTPSPVDQQQQQSSTEEETNKDVPLPQRKVTIKGSTVNQMRAQWHIFQRVKHSSRPNEMDNPSLLNGYNDNTELCLWTIVRVPRVLVGRIIGKGGRTVYNIQSSTATIINLPKVPPTGAPASAVVLTTSRPDTTPNAADVSPVEEKSSHQNVEIFGTFENTQLALGRIRALVAHALTQLYHQGHTLCPKPEEGSVDSHGDNNDNNY